MPTWYLRAADFGEGLINPERAWWDCRGWLASSTGSTSRCLVRFTSFGLGPLRRPGLTSLFFTLLRQCRGRRLLLEVRIVLSCRHVLRSVVSFFLTPPPPVPQLAFADSSGTLSCSRRHRKRPFLLDHRLPFACRRRSGCLDKRGLCSGSCRSL